MIDRASTDEDGPIRQQHGVQVHPWQAQGHGHAIARIRLGQRDALGAASGTGDVIDRPAADDHHVLVLRRRQQDAGRLVAEGADLIGWHGLEGDWIPANIYETRLLRSIVVHSPAAEEDATIVEQEDVRVKGQPYEIGIVGVLRLLPHVCNGIVDLYSLIELAIGAVLSAHGQDAAVVKREQGWIPASLDHRWQRLPLFSLGVKGGDVTLTQVVSIVVRLIAAGRDQSSIR